MQMSRQESRSSAGPDHVTLLALTTWLNKYRSRDWPTYPSGHWLFGFASKKYDPIEDLKADRWKSFGLYTRYYNTELHQGAFMLPTYVKEGLEHV